MTQPFYTRLADHILCIRAYNPSAMTGDGTNSYLVFGPNGGAVLVDAGPDLDSHFSALMQALGQARLEAIWITHAHLDHSALAPRLAAATGAKIASFGALSGAGQAGGEGADYAHRPDVELRAGPVQMAGLDWQIWHTPGHMQGHLCFGLGDSLFSGDHVMGWATSLVAPPEGDMAAYRASLRALQGAGYARYFSGHGGVIDTPEVRLAELLAHRAQREAQILSALSRSGQADAPSLARAIYADIPAALHKAAARNVLAHLIELHAQGRIRADCAPAAVALTTRFAAKD